MSTAETRLRGDTRVNLVKCLVWDLDGTIWTGVLSEGDSPRLRDGVVEVIQELDERGILQSIASKNDADLAWRQLEALGIADYFLFPQMGWGSKADSLKRIADSLNLAPEALALVDDDPVERAEIEFAHPRSLTLDAAEIGDILRLQAFKPRFVTDESRVRRKLYQDDIVRSSAEHNFEGSSGEFLATLDMRLKVHEATVRDLQRAEELTLRTHQLNTTGRAYSFEELEQFLSSPTHRLYVASLRDRFGEYGTIGLALLEESRIRSVLKLLLMSCRVMTRGVGSRLLHELTVRSLERNRSMQVEYVPNERNRIMLVTLRFAGFRSVGRRGSAEVLESETLRNETASPFIFVEWEG